MTINKKIKLPKLTPEQAQAIVDYLHANYDDSVLDWDNYCCTSDVAPDAYKLAINIFSKAYDIYEENYCNECNQKQTNGKCTNPSCELNPDFEECGECSKPLTNGECTNMDCEACPSFEEKEEEDE